MSLSTVNENDMRIKKFKQLDTKRDWSINVYNMDIPGIYLLLSINTFNKVFK